MMKCQFTSGGNGRSQRKPPTYGKCLTNSRQVGTKLIPACLRYFLWARSERWEQTLGVFFYRLPGSNRLGKMTRASIGRNEWWPLDHKTCLDNNIVDLLLTLLCLATF